MFVKLYPDLIKFSSTFLKTLFDMEIFTEEFLLQWYREELKLNKKSSLYKKRYITKFREAAEQFCSWLE